jgi:hypothetical protein
MAGLGLPGLVRAAGYPSTRALSSWQSVGSLLLAKCARKAPVHHIGSLTDDAGLAFTLGLTSLPKATHLGTYSWRVRRESNHKLLAGLVAALRPLGLATGQEGFNCDFHAIRHHGDQTVLEKHYVPRRSQRTRAVLTFFAQDHAWAEMVYANADITKTEQAAEIIAFAGYWNHATGSDPGLLVFDSQLTTYKILGQLTGRGINWLTLRQGVEEGKPLDDPGVVGARMHTAHIGCPADAADRLSELELAFASSLSLGRAGTRAIDGGDPRRIRHDKVNDLLTRQAALEGQDPAIIDDRNVEALPLSAHINADPQSHGSKHAPSQCARAPGGRGECSGSEKPQARPPLHGHAAAARHPPSRRQRELRSYKIAGRSAREEAPQTLGRRQIRAFAWRCLLVCWVVGESAFHANGEPRLAEVSRCTRTGSSVEATDRHPPGGWARGRSTCLCR